MWGNPTILDIVTALAASIGAVGILVAARQLQFSAWLKAQKLWTEPKFRDARGAVLKHWPDPPNDWSEDEMRDAFLVCRKTDEFARLAPFLGVAPWFGRRTTVNIWYDPIGKCWKLLEKFVDDERSRCGWPCKWDAFQELGQRSLGKVEESEE